MPTTPLMEEMLRTEPPPSFLSMWRSAAREKFHAPQLGLHLLDHLGRGLRARHVALSGERAHAEPFDLGLQTFGRLRALRVVEGHVGAAPCQLQGDGAADAARRARDDGGAPRKGFHFGTQTFLPPLMCVRANGHINTCGRRSRLAAGGFYCK